MKISKAHLLFNKPVENYKQHQRNNKNTEGMKARKTL